MNVPTVANSYERFVIEDIKGVLNSPQRDIVNAVSDIGNVIVDTLTHPFFSACRLDLRFKHNGFIEANDNLKNKVAFYILDYGSRGGVPSFGDQIYSNSCPVRGGECYLVYTPSLNEIHRFDAQETKTYYVEITEDYFTSMLGDPDDKFLGSLKDNILRGEFFGMKTNRQSSRHIQMISDLYECPFEGSLGNMMMEGSLQRFVALQLASFVDHPQKRESISKRDKEIMYAVKEYLLATFHENHSLVDLSKHFGINQNKLKKSFRELFGVPVIEYLYNLKMEQARLMLYDQGMNVSEVAPVVGYKNSNHFATAFKRKYGVSPSRVGSRFKV
jgi:AraC-like DNA-binding protein